MSTENKFDRAAYMKKYLTKYYKDNKDKYIIKIECEICKCKYMKSGKFNHEKSMKHKFAVLVNKNDKILSVLGK